MVMDNLVGVIDATTLIDRIHDIKQWVYAESMRIHIPMCSIEKAEQLYKASITPKEVPKEPPSKKAPVKAIRKEQPLFDINPRTTREFILRVQSGKDSLGVNFQSSEEQFTQWKEEGKQAVKAEQLPEGPPTSFAQALLRKLNMNDGTDASGSKVPAKPRLVARSSSPKSPWKYHKVPVIPASEVPEAYKSLFSCMLWRLHEYENNPLMPETHFLLTDNVDVRNVAQKLEIPTKTTAELRHLITVGASDQDHRSTNGDLERDFPIATPEETIAVNGNVHPDREGRLPENGFDFGFEDVVEPDEELEELKNSINIEKGTSNLTEKFLVRSEMEKSLEEKGSMDSEKDYTGQRNRPLSPTTALDAFIVESIKTEKEPILATKEISETTTVSPAILIGYADPVVNTLEKAPSPGPVISQASFLANGHHAKIAPQVVDDSDDDEEVVVFQPKSKRISVPPKVTAELERPKTATSAEQPLKVEQSQRSLRPHSTTTLKPQSPVFIPKKHLEQNQLSAQLQMESSKPSENPRSPAVNGVEKNATSVPQAPKRAPSGQFPKRTEGFAQRQSREIIQRQREAIQRQAQVASKPPPRQIQMQPTSTPTVIDPDAFDRSYVVQPSASSPSVQASGSSNGLVNGNRIKGRGSPKRAPRTPEPDVDFVLKSGTPRGSGRGRGKLWIP